MSENTQETTVSIVLNKSFHITGTDGKILATVHPHEKGFVIENDFETLDVTKKIVRGEHGNYVRVSFLEPYTMPERRASKRERELQAEKVLFDQATNRGIQFKYVDIYQKGRKALMRRDIATQKNIANLQDALDKNLQEVTFYRY